MKDDKIETLLNLLQHGNQLKRTARTGWIQRGVPNPEDVAAHSYGVVFATLILAQVVNEAIDLGRALAMAALHDLPEGLTSDIPTPAWRILPPGIKGGVERKAMSRILTGVDFGPTLMGLWEELDAGTTAEARLVHDADKIDLLLQAWNYEQQSGNRRLAEFWQIEVTWQFPQSRALYEALRQRRGEV